MNAKARRLRSAIGISIASLLAVARWRDAHRRRRRRRQWQDDNHRLLPLGRPRAAVAGKAHLGIQREPEPREGDRRIEPRQPKSSSRRCPRPTVPSTSPTASATRSAHGHQGILAPLASYISPTTSTHQRLCAQRREPDERKTSPAVATYTPSRAQCHGSEVGAGPPPLP